MKRKQLIKFKIFFICILGLNLFPLAFAEEVQVWAEARPLKLSPEDTLELIITVESKNTGASLKPRLPQLSDFRRLGEYTSSSVSIINGRVSAHKKYHYQLKPVKEGNFIIPPAEVSFEGRVYKTAPLEITVSSAINPQVQKKGPAPFGSFGRFFNEEDFFLKPPQNEEDIDLDLKLSKKKIYVGEMLFADWFLYRPGLSLPSSLIKKAPRPQGFWVENLTDPGAPPPAPAQERKQGQTYLKQVIFRLALFPVRPGLLKIDPLLVQLPLSSFSFFGPSKILEKSSPGKTVKVLPLPSEGKTKFFTGAVGDFKISGQVSKNQILQHQPFVYKITFKGRGHPRLIQLPKRTWPGGLELYDTTSSQKFSEKESVKTFELVFIPRKAGDLKVPEWELSSFNPDLGIYTLHILPALNFQVKSSLKVEPGGALAPLGEGQNSKDKEPLMQAPQKRWLWTFPALVLFVILWIFLRKNRFFIKPKENALHQKIKTGFQRAESFAQNKNFKRAGAELIQILYWVLSEQSTEPSHTKNFSILIQHWQPAQRRRYESELNTLVHELEILSFAPEPAAQDLRTPESLKNIIRRVVSFVKKVQKTS